MIGKASGADDGERDDKSRWSQPPQARDSPPSLPPRDALSRELSVTPALLAERRDKALAAIQTGLWSRELDHRDGFIHDLEAKIVDHAIQSELVEK